jgi:hypothetical protein
MDELFDGTVCGEVLGRLLGCFDHAMDLAVSGIVVNMR